MIKWYRSRILRRLIKFGTGGVAIREYDKQFLYKGIPQIIINELVKLTNQFFKELNMKKTLSRPTMNFDKEVLRHTCQYQCLIGNVRGNIIRR